MDDGNIFRKVLGALRQHASQIHDFSTLNPQTSYFPQLAAG